jgi:hypothetical protein
MRTILSISAFALLAACSDDRPVTAPTTPTLPRSAADAGVTTAAVAQAAGKPASFSLITTATGAAKTVFGEPSNQGASSIATCPAGSVVVGGGFSISIGARDIRIIESKPNAAGTAWVVNAAWYGDDFDGGNYAAFSAVATCIK